MHGSRRLYGMRAILVLAIVAGCRGAAARPPAVVSPMLVAPEQGVAPVKPAVAWSRGPVASATVAPGELLGLVVDAETGAPLADVQVAGRPGAKLVMTDSGGRFRMPSPNVQESLRVARIGYVPDHVTVVPRSDSGQMAVIALRPAAIVLCRVTTGGGGYRYIGRDDRWHSLPAPRYSGVVVIAHDAATGRAPVGVIAVSATDGPFRDSLTVRADTGDRAVAGLAPERPGRYDVIVRSARYRDWTGTSATRPMPGCPGEFEAAVFHAWLMPR